MAIQTRNLPRLAPKVGTWEERACGTKLTDAVDMVHAAHVGDGTGGSVFDEYLPLVRGLLIDRVGVIMVHGGGAREGDC